MKKIFSYFNFMKATLILKFYFLLYFLLSTPLRYIAIKSPLKNRVTHRKSKLVIFNVWIISTALASVQLFVARLEPISRHEDNLIYNRSECIANCTISIHPRARVAYACNEIWNSNESRQNYTLFNFFAIYLIPLSVLAFTYTCIGFIINSTTRPGNADYNRDMHYNKSKKKVCQTNRVDWGRVLAALKNLN